MYLNFSQRPGCRERDLQRRHDNPLYPEGKRSVSAEQLQAAQRADAEEAAAFTEAFRTLFEKAVHLDANVQSDIILELKQGADKLYEQAAGLAGDNRQAQQSLLKLIDVLMRAVRAGAANDPQALSEIEQETEARQMHMALLEYPLVADLLRPDSPIDPDSLAPTLLSCDEEELAMALQLFDTEQILYLHSAAQKLLDACRQEGHEAPQAWQRLHQIAGAAGLM
ncbi:hypothetical protein [Sulfuriflexus mobilis]|uniref:hypothetical protein n=1 Tax=Sulfuriflexus mobilis TaxID=1811807 RepID=UPI000F83FA43|nr:hypothetical protein [Sulfuriflexus mobilis]